MWQIVYPALVTVVGLGLLRIALSTLVQPDILLNTSEFNNPMPLPFGAAPDVPAIFTQSFMADISAWDPQAPPQL